MALEVGKNRVEAVGEVEEAVDLFAEYCRQVEAHHAYVIRLADGPGGERNQSVLRPYGVFARDLAVQLPAGPVGRPDRRAALLAGNTVVFKPLADDLALGRAGGRAAARGRRPGRGR